MSTPAPTTTSAPTTAEPTAAEPTTAEATTLGASAPTATPLAFTEAELATVQYNADGLVPAIIQEQATGVVLMMAWMNEDSLRQTLVTGRTWFWSRSRQEYWCKGETSGDRQWVRSVHYDCDGDALLLTVDQD